MFATSSQRKHWMFGGESSVRERRLCAHDAFVSRMAQGNGAAAEETDYLTAEEAEALRMAYERKLVEFCLKFSPPMPRSVVGTAVQYFKRFYINNSVMDYHPKEILVTAAFLACKVDEFNVSMDQFLHNIKGNKERATEIVLNNELLLMRELNFHLTIHNPYRPLEGLLIDVKSRCQSLRDPEALRKDIERFLDDILYTDAQLIYAPSQIALAAIIHAASKNGEHMDKYVTQVLFNNVDQSKLMNIVEAVRSIRLLVKNLPSIADAATQKTLLDKLERCRNQENNPESNAYKRKMQEMLEDDEDRMAAKHMRMDDPMSDQPMPIGSSP